MNQLEMICLDKMVLSYHRYGRFMEVCGFKEVDSLLKQIKSNNAYEGYGLTRIFCCLLLQFLEDLSDRELEVFLQENNAGKWFCGFLLNEDTPDHTAFSKARKKIGTDLLSKIFEQLRDQLKTQGYMSKVFTFVELLILLPRLLYGRNGTKPSRKSTKSSTMKFFLK